MPDEDVLTDLPELQILEIDGYKLDLEHFLKRDYDDISLASMELPAITEWVNSNLQTFVERKIVYKQEIKEVEAEVYLELLASDLDGKKTDAILSRRVSLDPRVKTAHRKYASFAAWVGRLENLMLSFQSKLDLVRSTESTRRKVFPDSDNRPNSD